MLLEKVAAVLADAAAAVRLVLLLHPPSSLSKKVNSWADYWRIIRTSSSLPKENLCAAASVLLFEFERIILKF